MIFKDKYYATAREAVEKYVKDGDTIALAGVSSSCVARELDHAVEDIFLDTGHPRDLTIITPTCPLGTGDCFAHEGLISKLIIGHYGSGNEGLKKFIAENKALAWNMPLGTMHLMYRAAGSGEPGYITKVGLGTFVDPRQQGGKLNDVTKDDIVDIVKVHGEDYMFYPALKPTVAFIRGTRADEYGNVSLDEEMYLADAANVARATHVNGGKVIVQVREYVKAGTIPAHSVHIPGIFVDAIVTTKDVPKNHRMTPGTEFSNYLLGKERMPDSLLSAMEMPLDARKVIARRAAMEVERGMVVNIGFGDTPEEVSAILTEEGVSKDICLVVEHGIVGGSQLPGERFAVHVNYDQVIQVSDQIDFFHAGGIDITVVGNAQCDINGNVNVHKFRGLPPGVGGFLDVVHATKNIVFVGTLTAKGLKEHIEDGKLIIDEEGSIKKFINVVPEITFSGENALKNGLNVTYVTERCVFKLTDKGLLLTEIADGIDIQKDILDQMEFKPLISDNLKTMDIRLFKPERMGI